MKVKKFHQLFESYSDNILDAKRIIDNIMDEIPCTLRISKGLSIRDNDEQTRFGKSTNTNVDINNILTDDVFPVFSYGYIKETSFHLEIPRSSTDNFFHHSVENMKNRLKGFGTMYVDYNYLVEEKSIRLDIQENVETPDIYSEEWVKICEEIGELISGSDKILSRTEYISFLALPPRAHRSGGIYITLDTVDKDNLFTILKEFETETPEDFMKADLHMSCKITNDETNEDLIVMFNVKQRPSRIVVKINSVDNNLSLVYLHNSMKEILKDYYD